MNENISICQKCTLCAHLLDEGWTTPRCVEACPTDCLTICDSKDLTTENLKAPLEQLYPESNDKPRIAYINLPKPFVGGEIASLSGSLVVNAKITVKHQVTGEEWFDYSDCLGGFKIDKLQPGFYTLWIEAPGYEFKRMCDLDVRASLNVETIKLTPLS